MISYQPHLLGESDLKVLQRDGIVKIDRFFPTEMIQKIGRATIRLRDSAVSHVSPAKKVIFATPLNTLKRFASIPAERRADLRYLSDVAVQCEFKRFAGLYIGGTVRLAQLASIESPVSDQPITAWHTDGDTPTKEKNDPANKSGMKFYSSLKFYIYLNDIDSSNGVFAYLPKSHRLVRAIRECIEEGTIAFCKTRAAADLRDVCMNPQTMKALLSKIPQHEIEEFISATDVLVRGLADTYAYDLSGPAGTLLVFDDCGFHRGGTPRASNRSILRYNYVSSRYWFWDKEVAPVKYVLQMAAKALLPRNVAAHW